MIIISESHFDHGLLASHVGFLLNRYKGRDEFIIESIALPDNLPGLPCSIRGPIVGDTPVPDEHCIMRVRGDRKWPSRMLKATEAWDYSVGISRILTIICGPAEGHPCVLYTAYGGPLAPKEPGDTSLHLPGKENELAEATAFWAEHALFDGEVE